MEDLKYKHRETEMALKKEMNRNGGLEEEIVCLRRRMAEEESRQRKEASIEVCFLQVPDTKHNHRPSSGDFCRRASAARLEGAAASERCQDC